MIRSLDLADVQRATGALVARGSTGDATHALSGVSTDTRSLRAGDLFVALSGPRHDGNAHAAAALAAGAGAVLLRGAPGAAANTLIAALPAGAPVLLAPDPLEALGDLAAWLRGAFTEPVVGITGSSGKTSTKEVLAALLGEVLPVHRSPASFNNAVGVPLTLLGAGPEARALVLELGTNAPGEIEALCRIARPTDGIVTGIGTAHLEGLGSREGIATEKGALPAALPAGGVCVLPADDPFRSALAARTAARVITFGERDGADVVAAGAWVNERGTSFLLRGPLVGEERQITVPLLGGHAARNCAASLALALSLGYPLDVLLGGLDALVPARGRLERVQAGGVTLLDDTYNANPDSVRAGLDVLMGLAARRRVLVLGGMHELGAASEDLHREVGERAARVVDRLVIVGDLARPAAAGARAAGLTADSCVEVGDVASALTDLRSYLGAGDAVLVKGSRAAQLERLTRALRDEPAGAGSAPLTGASVREEA